MKEKNLPVSYKDDLYDIATNCLYISVKKYELGRNTFINYWWTTTLRDFSDFFRATRKKNGLFIDPQLADSAYLQLNDVDSCAVDTGEMDNQTYRSLIDFLNNHIDYFRKDEQLVLKFITLGYSLYQISIILEMNMNKIYRIKSQIREKLNILMKNY